jgi:Zn-dependent peptidase ImmA (M78 family)
VAERLGVHRPTISEIEAGRRGVSSEELYQLARIYATTVGALLGDAVPGEQEALRVLFRGDGGFTAPGKVAAQRFLARCRAERDLEEMLGTVPAVQVRPVYQTGPMESKLDAIRQGERVAAEERRRLDLGSEPIRNIFELIEAQGIHLGPIEDGDDLAVDGLYFETDDLGACIAVNPTRDQATGFRSAFTAAHEFAHWVLRDVMVEGFTFLPGSGDLREVRANAFAAAFLMPAAGLKEHFRRTGRLRENDLAPVEIGDLVRAMDRFGVSRTALLYRLQNIGLLEAESGERMRGEEWDILHVARALGIKLRRDRYDAGRLRELAIEAWRRGLVSTSRAADLTRTDIADFRRRMKVMGIKQQDDETVPLVGAATRR